jgi:dihydrofolate reductase
MSKLRVLSFTVSLDGFGAGPGQDHEHPLGIGGPEAFDWFFHTRTFQRMHGNGEGEANADDAFAARSFDNIGAWIMGRNMFGPIRGPGPTTSGRAGGATSRSITCRCSC